MSQRINLGRVKGTLIYQGTAVTGTSATGTVFPSSGISDALVGDLYINTSTQNVYTCTLAGAAAVAKWAYTMNIKGATGPQGLGMVYSATEPTSQTEGSVWVG